MRAVFLIALAILVIPGCGNDAPKADPQVVYESSIPTSMEALRLEQLRLRALVSANAPGVAKAEKRLARMRLLSDAGTPALAETEALSWIPELPKDAQKNWSWPTEGSPDKDFAAARVRGMTLVIEYYAGVILGQATDRVRLRAVEEEIAALGGKP